MSASHVRRVFVWFSLTVLAALAILGLYILVIAPLLTSEAERVAGVVNGVVDAARQRDVGDMLVFVAEDYSDDFHQNRDELRQSLVYTYMHFKEWRVDTDAPPEVALAPEADKATAALRATVRLGTAAGVEPADDPVARIRGTTLFMAHLAKRDGQWLIVGCDDGKSAGTDSRINQ